MRWILVAALLVVGCAKPSAPEGSEGQWEQFSGDTAYSTSASLGSESSCNYGDGIQLSRQGHGLEGSLPLMHVSGRLGLARGTAAWGRGRLGSSRRLGSRAGACVSYSRATSSPQERAFSYTKGGRSPPSLRRAGPPCSDRV
jgi:hypothetical protein